jgi:hypothetical protein
MHQDVVRLYDLTVLCDNADLESNARSKLDYLLYDNKTQASRNPFAQPVAMLLLKIAISMFNSHGLTIGLYAIVRSVSGGARDMLTIKTLLLNILKVVFLVEISLFHARSL